MPCAHSNISFVCWWKEPCSAAVAMHPTGHILRGCKSAPLVNRNWKCNPLSLRDVQVPSWGKTSVLWQCPIPCPLTLIKAEYFSADSQRQMDFVNSSRDRGRCTKSITWQGWTQLWGSGGDWARITSHPIQHGWSLAPGCHMGGMMCGLGWALLLISVWNNDSGCHSIPLLVPSLELCSSPKPKKETWSQQQ